MTTVETGGPPPAPMPRSRIDLLDVLRGVALIAMAIYHFAWDLEFFGYVERGMTGMGGWKLFARSIASSFLFLVGVSLVLAHARAIRWRSYWIRFAQVVAGAAVITATTYLATPTAFVFFGILHQIALASLLGLIFLRLPWLFTALVGATTIALPRFFETSLTEPKWLAWIGMAEKPPVSNDFVPIFPWFGAVLLGIAAARLATDRGWWEKLRSLNPHLMPARPLGWLGRHSLLFYLLHQPLLFGLVGAFAQIAPPDPAPILRSEVNKSCLATGQDEAFCGRYSSCITERLKEAGLVAPVLGGLTTTDEDAAIGGMMLECSRP